MKIPVADLTKTNIRGLINLAGAQMIDRKRISIDTVREWLTVSEVDVHDSEVNSQAFDEYRAEREVDISHGLFAEDLPLLDAWYRLSKNFTFRLKTDGVVNEQGEWTAEFTALLQHGQNKFYITAESKILFKPRNTLIDSYEVLDYRLDGVNRTETSSPADFANFRAFWGMSIASLLYFIMFNDDLDKFAMEVRPLKPRSVVLGNPKLVKTKLAKVPQAPKIVFLNRLPTSSSSSSVADGSPRSIKLHQRAGHRRTLTHERYQNHPKYLIPKAVRVKPYWVGDRESSYQGHSYRVLIKESSEEDL